MRWAGYKNVCFSRQLPQTALIQTVQMLLAVFGVFRLLPGAVHVT